MPRHTHSVRLPETGRTLFVTDMHTAGEPVRILDDPGLELTGDMLAKRRQMGEQHDWIRQALMLEPHGHADMYGAVLTQAVTPGAEAGVLFMHTSGYSTMCGHASISLGRYLNDRREQAGHNRLDRMVLDCPCGPVTLFCENETTGFDSVACFADALDETVNLPGFGPVRFDLGYGGAYYAILPAERLGLSVTDTPLEDLRRAAGTLASELRSTRTITHPEAEDLGFLYGAILTDGKSGADAVSHHVCWFGEAQIDRSPTGSGVSARLAIAAARGEATPGQTHRFAGVSGEAFDGEIREMQNNGVVVHVSGRSFYSGQSSLVVEAPDTLGAGFSI